MFKTASFTLLFISALSLSLNAKQNQAHLIIPEMTIESINEHVNKADKEFTCLYCYSYHCDWCDYHLPFVLSLLKDFNNINFTLLIIDRASDTIDISNCINHIIKQDLCINMNNIQILSDSLYNREYRYLKPQSTKRFLRIYGGRKEGNKYINFIEKFIPTGLNKEPIEPKVIICKKNGGVVFTNSGDEHAWFSKEDEKLLKQILKE